MSDSNFFPEKEMSLRNSNEQINDNRLAERKSNFPHFQSYYQKFYSEKDLESLSSLSKIPSPLSYETYEEYEKAAKQWYESSTSKIKQIILPSPISLFFHRIGPQHELIKIKGYKQPQFIGYKNKLIYEEMLLKEDFITNDTSLVIQKTTKNYDFPISSLINIDNNTWTSVFIVPPPNPKFFNTYEDYEKEYLKWYEAHADYQNLSHFKHPNSFQNTFSFMPLPKSKSKVFSYNKILSITHKEREEINKITFFESKVKGLNENSKTLENNLDNLLYAYKNAKITIDILNPDVDEKYNSYQTKEGLVYTPPPSEVISILQDQSIDELYPPILATYQYTGKKYLAMNYDNIFKVCTHTDNPSEIGNNLVLNIFSIDRKYFTDTALFSFFHQIDTLIGMQDFYFLVQISQKPYLTLVVTKIAALVSPTPLIFYGDAVFEILENDKHPKDLQINHFIFNVLVQYHAIHILKERFSQSGTKQNQYLQNQYNGSLLMLQNFIHLFTKEVISKIENDITEDNMPTIVSIFNLMLDTPYDIKMQFFSSFSHILNLLNQISIINDFRYRQIILPFFKIEENRKILFKLFTKSIIDIKFNETQVYTNIFVSTFRILFIRQRKTQQNIKRKPKKKCTQSKVDLEYAPTLISHFIQYQSNVVFCYTIDTVCGFIVQRYISRKETDPCYVFEALSLLFAGLSNPSPSHYIMRSIGRLFQLDQAKDFLLSNNNWFYSLLSTMQNNSDMDLQSNAWRAFHALTEMHLPILLRLIRTPTSKEKFAQILKDPSVTALAELLKILCALFERMVKPESGTASLKAGMLFVLSETPQEIIEICTFLTEEGFRIDDVIRKLLQDQTGEYYFARFIVARYKRVSSERQTMRQLLFGRSNE